MNTRSLAVPLVAMLVLAPTLAPAIGVSGAHSEPGGTQPPPQRLATVVFQVRTDMKPGVDFTQIRTRLLADFPVYDPVGLTHNIPRDESGRLIIHDGTRPARAGEDWGGGIRVAEIGPLEVGPYQALVSALDHKGGVVIERPVRVTLERGVRVVTVLLTLPPKPPVDMCKAQFSKDRRECGLALKKCLEDGSLIALCQNTHDFCMRSAEARRDKCAAAAGAGPGPIMDVTPGAPPRLQGGGTVTNAEPTITVMRPQTRSGEIPRPGDALIILWRSSGLSTVKIHLEKGPRQLYTISPEGGVRTRDGVVNTYAWTIPAKAPPGNDYVVRIETLERGIKGDSPVFTVAPRLVDPSIPGLLHPSPPRR